MSADEIILAHAPRQKLAETVAQQLLDATRNQPAGTRLPSERELIKQLGVGRSTVREALKGLAMIGVVEIRHGQGVFIAERDGQIPSTIDVASAEAGELREARAIIEPEVARLAAQRRTPVDLRSLRAILTAHAQELAGETPPVLQASRFHVALADAAHNYALGAILRPFFRLMIEAGPKLYEEQPEYADWELGQHTAIFEAVKTRDADRAFALMSEHVQSMDAHYRA